MVDAEKREKLSALEANDDEPSDTQPGRSGL